MARRKVQGSRHLAALLRSRREALGYSRYAVVRLIQEQEEGPAYHVSEWVLRQAETAQSLPDPRQLSALARALLVDEDALPGVLRLDAYNHLRPTEGDFPSLMAAGKEAFEVGNFGRSFATYEAAVTEAPDLPARLRAQFSEAAAIMGLGLLALARWKYEAVLAEVTADDRAHAMACAHLAGLHDYRENLGLGLALAERAERLADPGDAELWCAIQNNKGNLLTNRVELHPAPPDTWLAEARACYDAALAAARSLGNRRYEATTLANRGRAACLAGDAAAGLPALEEARDLAEVTGDLWLQAMVESETGKARLRAGAPDAARPHLTRGLKLAREGDYPEWVVFCCILLTEVDRPGDGTVSFYRKLIDQYRGRVEKRVPELVRYDAREKAHGVEHDVQQVGDDRGV